MASRHSHPKRPEPIDQRGDLKEAAPSLLPDRNGDGGENQDGAPDGPRDHPPPPRLPSLHFPTDRLPQLGVEIVKRLPGVGDAPTADEHDPKVNFNIDPSLPLPVEIEKTMFNLWENTQTQTEVRWKQPENRSQFSGMYYQLELKKGDADWIELAENRQSLYRIYYVDGVAIFGRHRINQDNAVQMIRLRIRPVGENSHRGKVDKKIGPWSDEILFSLEGVEANREEIE